MPFHNLPQFRPPVLCGARLGYVRSPARGRALGEGLVSAARRSGPRAGAPAGRRGPARASHARARRSATDSTPAGRAGSGRVPGRCAAGQARRPLRRRRPGRPAGREPEPAPVRVRSAVRVAEALREGRDGRCRGGRLGPSGRTRPASGVVPRPFRPNAGRRGAEEGCRPGDGVVGGRGGCVPAGISCPRRGAWLAAARARVASAVARRPLRQLGPWSDCVPHILDESLFRACSEGRKRRAECAVVHFEYASLIWDTGVKPSAVAERPVSGHPEDRQCQQPHTHCVSHTLRCHSKNLSNSAGDSFPLISWRPLVGWRTAQN